jgi:hypothetical protein
MTYSEEEKRETARAVEVLMGAAHEALLAAGSLMIDDADFHDLDLFIDRVSKEIDVEAYNLGEKFG